MSRLEVEASSLAVSDLAWTQQWLPPLNLPWGELSQSGEQVSPHAALSGVRA